ncbi:glucose-6-phosphate 1-dehydrogenase [Kordiimonas sediminis]|uniref:Glucose-6-phosphate 1-dehydrogenase n=1 Tax=Kordiimonas sediminis TaxID=1735581 RepID=A0A919E575_9PROT|nr:glucose-6-phosphate dehydrogenase [Kordiimonas sediminis]GHF13429.1 glucose-6-phosphate 1-dehydrogenase [Kordiimonas sediminis]
MHLFDLVIYGGTGDLSRKKLLPALYAGFVSGRVDPVSRIFLTTRSAPDEDVLPWLADVLAANGDDVSADDQKLQQFAAMVSIVPLSLTDKEDDGWKWLVETLQSCADRPIIHFLAIPPSVFTSVCAALSHHQLNTDRCRIVLEKPLGHDLASAREINADVACHFDESQTFRIDHYLGKEAVQNLLALRFSNILFERLWNNQTIDHVQISIAEDLGLAGRGGYYEGVGALRDMVQNHLLQLLCLVAMEPPARMDAESIREEKLKVLKSLSNITNETIKTDVVRGQYSAGTVAGQQVDGYCEDMNLDGNSNTETYVAIKTFVENWRWAGVPFYLRTGKRLPDRFAEIMIQFKDVPHSSSPDWQYHNRPNRFIIRLQPVDHLALRMMVKNSAEGQADLKEVELNLDVSDPNRLGPYLRLIFAVAEGDQSLFVHREEVEYAWRWVDGIISKWDYFNITPVEYPAGSWGPYEAHDLLRSDGRAWFHEKRG